MIGLAVATMAIVLSVYLKHEEAFRARFKLIMRDMVRNSSLMLIASETIVKISIYNKTDNIMVNVNEMSLIDSWLIDD